MTILDTVSRFLTECEMMHGIKVKSITLPLEGVERVYAAMAQNVMFGHDPHQPTPGIGSGAVYKGVLILRGEE